MFVDNVEIKISAGKGGSGLASFRREKFRPFGGPDGGDGGKGSDIYFLADGNMEDLGIFKHKLSYRGSNGGTGGPNQRHGINGTDLVIKVPVGTTVYVKEAGKELLAADLRKDGQKALLAKGGRGGKGNVHFATSTRKAPVIFQPGEEGQKLDITLKVRLPLDVCILGYPNSGKSALIAAMSAARPAVADYPFTTREPVMAMVDDGIKKYSWAEIPAIVEEGQKGKGAGNQYLSQTDRASVLVYLLDVTFPDVLENFTRLRACVIGFDIGIGDKKSVIAVNKIDLIDNPADLDALKVKLTALKYPVFYISASEKLGINELVTGVHQLVTGEKRKEKDQMQPEVIFRPKPVDRRS